MRLCLLAADDLGGPTDQVGQKDEYEVALGDHVAGRPAVASGGLAARVDVVQSVHDVVPRDEEAAESSIRLLGTF